ncbi:MAG: hypothetical protein CM15mP79_1690 [Methanobacteriota archaeon]|nr:MAG: hypothetical protein CM15mP79_1690 [Euryarchaeota archaeon]
MAADFGLQAKVVDMDGADTSALAAGRLLIITSTWGEGEMPDNAETLWQATNSANPGLGGTHLLGVRDRRHLPTTNLQGPGNPLGRQVGRPRCHLGP